MTTDKNSTKLTPIQLMQEAVNIVQSSQVKDQVAATVASHAAGETQFHSAVNAKPLILKEHFDDQKIGDASATGHAEFITLQSSPFPTNGCDIFVTDPLCPNCAKNVSEAGISNIYIDHKGFDKPVHERNADYFNTMSMRIFEKAGMGVHVINRKAGTIETLLEARPATFKPIEESPVQVKDIDPRDITEGFFSNIIERYYTNNIENPFAMALAKDKAGNLKILIVERHSAIGWTMETLPEKGEKYSLVMQPLNRLMMAASRLGYTIDPHHIFCSRVPTAREQVNFVAAGFNKIMIGNMEYARDPGSQKAMKMLRDKQVVNFQAFSPAP